jgi:hypothetical protein
VGEQENRTSAAAMVTGGWPTTHFSGAVPMDVIGCHPEDPARTRQKYHLGVLDQNN